MLLATTAAGVLRPLAANAAADRGAQQRAEHAPSAGGARAARRGAGHGADGHRPGAGGPAGRPAQRGHQRGADRDALPERRDLAGALPGPGDRLGRASPAAPSAAPSRPARTPRRPASAAPASPPMARGEDHRTRRAAPVPGVVRGHGPNVPAEACRGPGGQLRRRHRLCRFPMIGVLRRRPGRSRTPIMRSRRGEVASGAVTPLRPPSLGARRVGDRSGPCRAARSPGAKCRTISSAVMLANGSRRRT